jgi:tryptophan-rich sensory protein
MSIVQQVSGLAICLVVSFAVAGIGSLVTIPALTGWYAGLQKPEWTPPNWLFGPVWTVLYLAMAIAAWLVWRRVGLSGGIAPLGIFGVQLALNLIWTIIFFGSHDTGLAFIEVVLLWLAILTTIFAFRHVSIAAGWLLVPYLAWVTFAAALNFAVWRLNR